MAMPAIAVTAFLGETGAAMAALCSAGVSSSDTAVVKAEEYLRGDEVAASGAPKARAALLYDLLDPFAGRLLAAVIGLACLGAAERYQGIRPAPGYPACPDHTQKRALFDLLGAEERAGITLTESFAMLPTAAVSGWYFWHPDAHYFGVGRIGRDQVGDYARRTSLDLETAERWLAPNLAYER